MRRNWPRSQPVAIGRSLCQSWQPGGKAGVGQPDKGRSRRWPIARTPARTIAGIECQTGAILWFLIHLLAMPVPSGMGVEKVAGGHDLLLTSMAVYRTKGTATPQTPSRSSPHQMVAQMETANPRRLGRNQMGTARPTKTETGAHVGARMETARLKGRWGREWDRRGSEDWRWGRGGGAGVGQ